MLYKILMIMVLFSISVNTSLIASSLSRIDVELHAVKLKLGTLGINTRGIRGF